MSRDWVTLETGTTSANGTWKWTFYPEGGTYRLKAIDTWSSVRYCLGATSTPIDLP